MAKYFVSFTDLRDPPKVKPERIAVQTTLMGEAIEEASAIFFEKHPRERHEDFDIRLAPSESS